MRLTLTYRGPLPPKQRGVSPVKAQLRRAFHPQVKSQLQRLLGDESAGLMTSSVAGHKFISPAHTRFRTAVDLDVLILTSSSVRPGDVDNRLKTLIDGLTRPANEQQLADFAEPGDGGATFCLLDDDKLVERMTVDTRSWHEPGLSQNDALVIVTANLILSENADMQTPFATLFFLVS